MVVQVCGYNKTHHIVYFKRYVMWVISQKSCYFIFLFIYFFFFGSATWLAGSQNLSSLTRDWTWQSKHRVLIPGLSGNSQSCFLKRVYLSYWPKDYTWLYFWNIIFKQRLPTYVKQLFKHCPWLYYRKMPCCIWNAEVERWK